MNRQTTTILKKIAMFGSGLLGLLIFFGGSLLTYILKFLGIKSEMGGLIGILMIPIGGVFVLGIIAVSIIVYFRQQEHRSEDLQKLAKQNSWNYAGSTPLPFLKEFDAYLNSSWAGSNALSGSSNNVVMGTMNERNILFSDQIYRTGSGKHSQTHRKTLAAIELREANLPFMCLQPEGFFDRVFDGMTKYDIDFPTHPNFSQKYVLYGVNENQIRSFFDEKILAFYEQQPLFNTACGGRYLVIWGDGLLNPAEIMAQLNFLSTLANLFLKK